MATTPATLGTIPAGFVSPFKRVQQDCRIEDAFACCAMSYNKTLAEVNKMAVTLGYPTLKEADIKTLVVDDKWLSVLSAAIHSEMDRISQALTQRVKELAERYDTPMPQMVICADWP